MTREKNNASAALKLMPMLKTVSEMSKVSGIGEHKLRELIEKKEIEYVENGNKRLLADQAIWDWYQRNRITAHKKEGVK